MGRYRRPFPASLRRDRRSPARTGAGARPARVRARAARRRDHQPQLPRTVPRPRLRRAPAGQGHRPARDRPRGERAATAAAASSGSGPRDGVRAERGCLVTAFIEARPVPPEELRTRRRGRRALRAIHAGPPLPRLLAVRAHRALRAHGARARRHDPPPLSRGTRHRRRDRGGTPYAPVPCHNDLLTANFLDDGSGCGSSTGSTRVWATGSSTSGTSRATTTCRRRDGGADRGLLQRVDARAGSRESG